MFYLWLLFLLFYLPVIVNPLGSEFIQYYYLLFNNNLFYALFTTPILYLPITPLAGECNEVSYIYITVFKILFNFINVLHVLLTHHC